METIRKAVESLTGDAGIGHKYGGGGETYPTEEQQTTAPMQERGDAGAAAGGATGGISRSPATDATTTRYAPSTTTTTVGRDESWQPRSRTSGEAYGGREEDSSLLTESRERVGGRASPTEATSERGRSAGSGQQTDEERRRMTQQQSARDSELAQRRTGATSERVGSEQESKPITQRLKESVGMGGAEAQRSEQGRQLGLERGQVPYGSQAEAEAARRRRDEEQAAIGSGRAWEGQRLKSPEYFPSAPYERGYETGRGGEEKTESYGGGRGGEERGVRGRGRGDEGFFSRTFHEIERAVGGLPVIGAMSGGAAAGAGLGASMDTRSVTTTSRYPICLRTLLKPRPDIKDSKLEGDIIMVQESPSSPTQVIGSVRGINPGLHGMAILENGDLTLQRSSAGLHWDAPGSRSDHGGANTSERHLGDLGNIEVKGDGVAFFNFRMDNLPLLDVAGRSLAVMSGEDDLGQSYCMCSPGACGKSRDQTRPHTRCGAQCRGAAGNCTSCISQINGNAGHALGLGVIFRTDLDAMERIKNVRLGVGVGEETHREVWGRPMDRRPEVRERGMRGERGERESGWEKFKHSMKRSFGSRDEERAAREQWERGQTGGRGYEERGYDEPGYYSKSERTRGYDEPSYSRERESQRGGGGFLGGLFGSKDEPSYGRQRERERYGYGPSRSGRDEGYEKRSHDEPKGGLWERDERAGYDGGTYERPSEARIRGTDQGVSRDIGGKIREFVRPGSSRAERIEY